MKGRSLLSVGISLGILFGAASLIQPDAQAQTAVSRQIQFRRGTSSTTLKGSVVLGKRDVYTFRARKGQTIILDLDWQGERVGSENEEGLSGFTFVQPNGESMEHPQNNYFLASSTGTFRIIVAQPYRLTSPRYTLRLEIR